ncbi:NUDIX domain-containing protein [Parasegetibacter sp. NRK P23]|uniref:NUDIX hydrolase n=1 Tax=Parasegetibacter sp. NRK P23 TaxID=2942999 RepID=UPI002043ED54|nr:NUDIX domain-containing protein [Parasegetibacter sp. NRK P23]MCM5527810.1 NUDIX hydrolase [Parasegetibacter sp. NRK P23]
MTRRPAAQPNINTTPISIADYFKVAISVDCVIFGFDEGVLKVLLIKCNLDEFNGEWSLLGDLVRPDEDLDKASYRILKERTGLDDVYLEQVHTFGSLNRHPNGRVVTTAYYSLVNIQHHELQLSDNELHWHPFNEIRSMAFDHMQILQTCYTRLQQKVLREPVVFNLLPPKFSLRDLQSLYEAILGVEMDRRNFRKKFFQMGFLVDTEQMEDNVPHRPGKLYKFNHRKYSKLSKKALDINF